MKSLFAVLFTAIVFVRTDILNLDIATTPVLGGLESVQLYAPRVGLRKKEGRLSWSISGGPLFGSALSLDHFFSINGQTVVGGNTISFMGTQSITETRHDLSGYSFSAEIDWELQ